MDRSGYEQLDRMETKLDLLLRKVSPELFKDEEVANAEELKEAKEKAAKEKKAN